LEKNKTREDNRLMLLEKTKNKEGMGEKTIDSPMLPGKKNILKCV
jgi:hypothetical protein